MQLNRQSLSSIFPTSKAGVSSADPHNLPGTGVRAPDPRVFDLPEKVLQFGTGVLLRGLPDHFIGLANEQGLFNGRIVVVKSTGTDTGAFGEQDGLYTLCIRGLVRGREVAADHVHAVISRALAARTEWNEVLKLARSSDLQLIISNTTEIGISYVPEQLNADPPESFPGKLLAVLYERYQALEGRPGSGLVIIPTELITDNAGVLFDILLKLAAFNELPGAFVDWLREDNHFCNSLVDRIVPGALPLERERAMQEALGYTDQLMIMSEAYALWAIETPDERVKQVLTFSQADPAVVIAPDISRFRTLKLRLLNGSHSFCCALALLGGFRTVREAMEDAGFLQYIRSLMTEEIVPSITDDSLGSDEAIRFAEDVIDRFSNPYLEHQWQSISLQYTSKMRMRNVPLIAAFAGRTGRPPLLMARGFAAYLLLMLRPVSIGFELQDQHAAFFDQFRETDPLASDEYISQALAAEELWGMDLGTVPGFADAVKRAFRAFRESSFQQAAKQPESLRSL